MAAAGDIADAGSSGALALHIPAPAARPGDAPTFDHLALSAAGAVARPDIDAPAATLRELPFALIRVLGDDGDALGPWNPRLHDETLVAVLGAMVLTRTFEDRMFRAHRQGKTSFFMKSTGEEAIAVTQALALADGDMCFPTYRCQGWLIARGYPLVHMMNQIFSNAQDPLKGRQLPILYSARDYGFYSLSGNVGSRFGHAVGWAMASAYKSDRRIALGVIGDGTTAEGDFHEALTFASVYRAPVILGVTNNQWAISTFTGIAGGDATPFAARAIGYGIPGLRVDGNDVLAVWAATTWAAERARANLGPTLIEYVTYRAAGHSTSDDPTRYRPTDEPAHWPLGDPIERLKSHLFRRGTLDAGGYAEIEATALATVKAAQKEAEAVGTLGRSRPPLREMFADLFSEPDWRLTEQLEEASR